MAATDFTNYSDPNSNTLGAFTTGGSLGNLGTSIDGSNGSSSTTGSSAGTGINYGQLISGVGGGLASYFGGQTQSQGYQNASNILGQLQGTAGAASSLADPFAQYRQGQAAYLNNILTGKQSIQTDPGYQFAQQAGQQAVQRSASAQGLGASGNVMAALQQRGQDIANQQYGSIIDRLTNLAGAGSQNAMMGGQVFGNISSTGIQGQASSAVGQGNSKAGSSSGGAAIGSALGGIAGFAMGGGPVGGAIGSSLGGMIGGLF
jgi:hypothetical protein